MKITWIYPENNKPIGVGEATVPAVTNFLKKIDITPEIILKELNGSLKLGIKFKNFSNECDTFCHPFGNTDIEAKEINELMNRNHIHSNILEYEEIATHFDVSELMNYLDNIKFNNVQIHRKEINDFNEIEDSIIIDCTGFNSKFNKSKFKSILNDIPNDTALVYRGEYKDKRKQQVPYTTVTGMNNGWIWNIPLGNKLSVGYVHSSKYNVKKEFINYLNTQFNDVQESKIQTIKMTTGRNEEHIIEGDKIVISLGLSSFFIEPLESTGLYLVTYGIELMDKYLKNEISAKEYNSTYNYEFDVILEFIKAHYKFSNRTNEYWDYYKSLNAQLYKENNIFPKRSWYYILDGLEVISIDHELNSKSLLKLRKSQEYYKWLENEKNPS